MVAYLRPFAVIFALLLCGAALAQEPKGWLGADVLDVTKAEADKLGWDTPRGAKVGIVAPGSPADKAGLKTGDIITGIDRTIVDTSSDFDAVIGAKRPGDEVRLQVFSGGPERRVTVALANPPPERAAAAAMHLTLDTGGHNSLIRAVAFTPDGRLLVSAGEDKVVRIWDWRSGKTIRTIRGQIEPGTGGHIYAMALSPDGRWLAVGGRMTTEDSEMVPAIKLHDFETGQIKALLRGHNNVVAALAFSPDGKHLVSSSADRSAIIWDVADAKVLHRLRGHDEIVWAVAFSRDGARVVTGSGDRTLRLWNAVTGAEIAVLKGHEAPVERVAASPTEDMIASASKDGEIRLWRSDTGRFLRTIARHTGSVGALRYAPHGEWLVSSSSAGPLGKEVFVWETATGRQSVTFPRHDNSVYALAVSPDGRWVASGGGNRYPVYVWDAQTGLGAAELVGTGLPKWGVGFAKDGRAIAWGSSSVTGSGPLLRPLEQQLELPREGQPLGRPLALPGADSGNFVRARIQHSPYSLHDHDKPGVLVVNKEDKPFAFMRRDRTNGYEHYSYTFSNDAKEVISGGSNGHLLVYDLASALQREPNIRMYPGGPVLFGRFPEEVARHVGHESQVWAVTPSEDGRFLISGGADQTIRLWNLKTRELIATLFHGSDGEWVMWTPQGYYTGSPGSDKIVGWQINKGPEHAAEYVGADQLRQHLNRPDIVERAIVLASAEQAVREARGTTFKLADLLARPVPRFEIVLAKRRQGRATVTIAIEATPDPVRSIRVQVNGRHIDELTPPIDSGGFGAGEQYLEVPLGKGRNDVRVTLANAIGEKARTLELVHDGDGELDERGTLYILAIGVNDYKRMGNTCGLRGNEPCELRVSGTDARAFADAVERRLGSAHDKVIKRVLVNGSDPKDEPTAINVIDAVGALRRTTDEKDTVVLFIAGHGKNEGSSYRFLPTNAEWADGSLRGSTVVPWQILQEAIEGARGRRLLFVDTCHSGNAYNQRLGNATYHANIIAYTAARFDQAAIEDHRLGHGLFTYAVVEGLDGKGEIGTRRQLSTKDLADYVVKRVGQLAKELQSEQEPQYFKGRDAEDYVLARW